jgi:polyisoprenoid-binding protein YceI
MYKLIVFLLIKGLCFAAFAGSATVTADVDVKPIGDFLAKFEKIEVKITKEGDKYKAERFLIPWKSMKTGLSLRDKHALDYFNASKHPNIEVVAALGEKGKGVAKVKMNGVEHNVDGTYSVEGGNLVAEIPLSLKKFEVKRINFKGAGVQDIVNIKVVVPVN